MLESDLLCSCVLLQYKENCCVCLRRLSLRLLWAHHQRLVLQTAQVQVKLQRPVLWWESFQRTVSHWRLTGEPLQHRTRTLRRSRKRFSDLSGEWRRIVERLWRSRLELFWRRCFSSSPVVDYDTSVSGPAKVVTWTQMKRTTWSTACTCKVHRRQDVMPHIPFLTFNQKHISCEIAGFAVTDN